MNGPPPGPVGFCWGSGDTGACRIMDFDFDGEVDTTDQPGRSGSAGCYWLCAVPLYRTNCATDHAIPYGGIALGGD